MCQTFISMRRIGAVLASAYALVLVASVQAQAPPIESATAEQAYRNIKVLRGTPATELILSMHYIKGALGVSCEYCHVEGNFPSDAKKPKETARQMISMVLEINKNTFQGRQVVTCYTCHRGSSQPVGTPVYPIDDFKPEAAPVALPSADQVLQLCPGAGR